MLVAHSTHAAHAACWSALYSLARDPAAGTPGKAPGTSHNASGREARPSDGETGPARHGRRGGLQAVDARIEERMAAELERMEGVAKRLLGRAGESGWTDKGG